MLPHGSVVFQACFFEGENGLGHSSDEMVFLDGVKAIFSPRVKARKESFHVCFQ